MFARVFDARCVFAIVAVFVANEFAISQDVGAFLVQGDYERAAAKIRADLSDRWNGLPGFEDWVKTLSRYTGDQVLGRVPKDRRLAAEACVFKACIDAHPRPKDPNLKVPLQTIKAQLLAKHLELVARQISHHLEDAKLFEAWGNTFFELIHLLDLDGNDFAEKHLRTHLAARDLHLALQDELSTAEQEVKGFRERLAAHDPPPLFLYLADLRIGFAYCAADQVAELLSVLRRLENFAKDGKIQLRDIDRLLLQRLKLNAAVYQLQPGAAHRAIRAIRRRASKPWSNDNDERERVPLLVGAELHLARFRHALGDTEGALQQVRKLGARQQVKALVDSSAAFSIHLHYLLNLFTTNLERSKLTEAEVLKDYESLKRQIQDDENLPAATVKRLLHHIGNEVGHYHLVLGKPRAAVSPLVNALKLAHGDRMKAETLVNLGWANLMLGDAAEAVKTFRQALDIFRSIGEKLPRTAECQGYLARAQLANNQVQKARENLEAALSLREEYAREGMSHSLSERERTTFVLNLRAHAEAEMWPGVLDTFLELGPQLSISVEQQYRHVLFWRGLVFRTSSRAMTAEQQKASSEVIQKILTLAAKRFFAKENPPELLRIDQQLDELEEQLAAIERDATGPLEKPSTNEIRIWRPSEPEQQAFLEIVTHRSLGGDDIYLLFSSLPGRGFERTTLGSGKEIESEVESLRSAIRNSITRNDTSEQQAAKNRVIAKSRISALSRRFPDLGRFSDIERVSIVADGVFQQCPFASLVAENGKRWCELAAIEHLVDCRHGGSHSEPEAPAWCVVGGITFGSTPEGKRGFPDLPRSNDEVGDILELIGNSAAGDPTYLGKTQVTRNALLSELRRANYFHISTHGYFDDEGSFDAQALFRSAGNSVRLSSSIVLSNFNQESAEDQWKTLLTAAEIRRYRLPNLKTVVLSGCETGLGEVKAGMGLVGIQESFLEAGSDEVVCSLWKVHDSGTASLMREYYRKFVQDPELAPHALSQAQVALMNGEDYKIPYYWAGWRVVRPRVLGL